MSNIIKATQHSPINIGDLEYIKTFVKGKKKKYSVKDYRILVRTVSDNKEYMLWVQDNAHYQPDSFALASQPVEWMNRISEDHIKNACYNYYAYGVSKSHVHEFLKYLRDNISAVPDRTDNSFPMWKMIDKSWDGVVYSFEDICY